MKTIPFTYRCECGAHVKFHVFPGVQGSREVEPELPEVSSGPVECGICKRELEWEKVAEAYEADRDEKIVAAYVALEQEVSAAARSLLRNFGLSFTRDSEGIYIAREYGGAAPILLTTVKTVGELDAFLVGYATATETFRRKISKVFEGGA